VTAIDEIRSFNRFYTREIGLLDEHLPASDLSLAEARVLYELAQREGRTAAEIGRQLTMDKAHLSRILGRFRMRGYVSSEPAPEHRKRLILSLTGAGRAFFAQVEAGTRAQMETILTPLDQGGRQRLFSAMREIKTVLGGVSEAASACLRPLQIGDLGWITHRQAILYNREYGWDWRYEGLVSGIMARFAAEFDPAREDAWVAEHDGRVVGSIFLMKGDDPATAKLRLLYVEPAVRGLGIGRTLVDACIARARALGYAKLTLWTNDILVSARRIYEAAGFQLAAEEKHHSFGHDLVGQTWDLALD
jgi:DNA-binding MarR family transcriptional regulator/GNAT superfamily N-acetyltransferase